MTNEKEYQENISAAIKEALGPKPPQVDTAGEARAREELKQINARIKQLNHDLTLLKSQKHAIRLRHGFVR